MMKLITDIVIKPIIMGLTATLLGVIFIFRKFQWPLTVTLALLTYVIIAGLGVVVGYFRNYWGKEACDDY